MSVDSKTGFSFSGCLSHILKQAWPILISQWAGIAFAVMDSMMLGHFSPDSLQAMALATSIFLTVNIGLMGVVHALIPICAQLLGANKKEEIGRFWGQGLWLSFTLSLLGGLVLLFPEIWLSMSGDVPAHVRHEVAIYLRIIFIALPASLMFRAVYALCTAVQKPKLVMQINLFSIALKALLNWLLIFGQFGLPALGSAGASTSTAIVSWLMFFAGLWILFHNPFYRQFNLTLGRPQHKYLAEILKLGIPMGGSYLVEVSAFTFMALLAAREGTFVSGGHQVLSNMTAILYMMPLSLGIATSSLAARAVGSRNFRFAHQIATSGLFLSLIGAGLSITIVLLGKPLIIQAYTSDAQVAVVAGALLTIVPLLHFSDTMQCMISYILRAYKIATIPFILQTVLLLGLGLAGGWYFGFGNGIGLLWPLNHLLTPGAPVGVSSLWIMCSLSLLICAIFLHVWYWRVIYAKRKSW
ncbi:MATE family efflux transporter [Advenella faeciporci]|uniref:Multidrug-efflux transporter n=1 Tax=Advenella faeciporci TaxID=797535 RepID=A0A918JEJ5_9BURK|nr:MATE family efflux transporter [Advenella faeciporci]GGW76497.1 MATE family efflux transporter [Advenella faeciporci]